MAATSSETALPAANEDLSADDQGRLAAVMVILRGGEHPEVKALHSKVDAVAHPSSERRVLKRFNDEVVELRKADPKLSRSEAMERVRKGDRKLERELYDVLHGA